MDYDQLPKNYYKRFYKKAPGAYLVLRTNRDRTQDIRPEIFKLFRIKKYGKGKLRIIRIDEFEKYKQLMINLDVSVFKVVKN